MKTVNLQKRRHSLAEVLKLAKLGAIRVHSADGEDFIVEQADDFDKEVALLGRSEKFARFLNARRAEGREIPMDEVCEKRCLVRGRRKTQ